MIDYKDLIRLEWDEIESTNIPFRIFLFLTMPIKWFAVVVACIIAFAWVISFGGLFVMFDPETPIFVKRVIGVVDLLVFLIVFYEYVFERNKK